MRLKDLTCRGLWVVCLLWIVGTVAAQHPILKEEQDFQFAVQLGEREMHDLAALQLIKFSEQYPTSPQAPTALFRAAQNYEMNNQPDQAAEIYLRLLLRYPQSDLGDKALFNRGKILSAAGEHLEAALTFERIRLFKPESDLIPVSMLHAAREYLSLNDHKRAQTALFYILEKFDTLPIRFEARYFLARTYCLNNQLKSALKELDRIMGERLDPNLSVNVRLLRGQILQHLGQYAQADSLLESLLTREMVNDSVGVAAIQLVQSLSSRGLYDRAHRVAEKTLSLNLPPKIKNRLYSERADIYYATQDYRAAIASLELVNTDGLSPMQAAFHQFRFAAIRHKLGQKQRALEAYLSLCELADTTAAILQLQKRCFIIACHLLCDMQRSGEALRLLRRLYDERPQWRDSILMQKGRIQQDIMQDYTGARLTYGMVLEFYPLSPLADDALIGMARCYEQEGDYDQAMRCYDQYLKLFLGSDEYEFARQRWQYLHDFAPKTKNPLPFTVQQTLTQLLWQQGQRDQLFEWAKEQIQSQRDYQQGLHLLRLVMAGGDPLEEIEWMYWAGLCHARLAQKAHLNEETEAAKAQIDTLRQLAEWMIQRAPNDKRTQSIYYEWLSAELSAMANPYDRAMYLSQAIQKISASDSLKQLLQFRLAEAWYQAGKENSNMPMMQRGLGLSRDLLRMNTPSSLAAATLLLQFSIYSSLGKSDSAAMSLRTCIDRFSNAPQVSEAMWNLARLLEQQLQFAEAASLYQDLARRFYYASQGQNAQRQYCRALFRQKQYQMAENCVQEHLYLRELQELRFYLQEDLDDETLWLAAQIQIDQQNSQSAIDALRTYLNFSPGGAHRGEAYWTLAELYAKINNPDAALAHYQAIVNQFPQDTLAQMAQFRSADVLFELGRYPEAKKLYESIKMSAAGSSRQMASAREIVCEYRLGNIARARTLVDAYKKQFKDRIAEANFLKEDAQYCMLNKDFKAAEDQFKELASRYRDLPEGADGELGLARLYVILNRTEEALKILTNIPNKYSDARILALAYVNLGEFYYENRQLENCIAAGRKALEYEKKSPERQRALSLLIRIYDDLRLWDNAMPLLREYIEQYPDAADHFSRRIQLGVFLVNLKEFERGIAVLRDLLPEADAENEAEIQYWIAQAYASWGQLSEALIEYLKVRYACRPTKLPWGTTALYEAGKIYVKLGDLRRARGLFQQIVREQGLGDQFGRVANERVKEIDAILAKEKPPSNG